MRKIMIIFAMIGGLILNVMVGVLAPGGVVNAVEINEKIPEIYIKAVNPGYTIDEKSNVGEMIEISRKNSDTPILLAGFTVGYTNSSGNYSVLYEFPEHSWMTGETILLRLASSPESELATMNYTKTLAFKAGVELKKGEEVIDAVCWTGKGDCYRDFRSADPTVLVRNLISGEFEHVDEYEPEYRAENYYVEVSAEEEGYGAAASQCRGLVFSEILSYYETSKTEQFIEFYNSGTEQILMDGCKIKYKNKYYGISGMVKAEGYFVYYPVEFNLTKNPTNSNVLELIDTDGVVIDRLEYPNGQRKGAAYAFIGYDRNGEELWRVTYAPTPGEANNYQEYKTCEVGKIINKETGNCVKVTEVKDKICKEGYYLNILTGRCRKIEASTEKTCKEGYYLNPDTGRCRKIAENTGASYNLEPENYEEKSSFVGLLAVLGVLAAGLIYVIYEFRGEIGKFWEKIFKRRKG